MAGTTSMFSNNISFVALLAFCLACSTIFTSPTEATGNDTAAFYDSRDASSACPNGTVTGGRFPAMVPTKVFANGAACGRVYEIRCVGAVNAFPRPCKGTRSVTVTVANQCGGDCDTFTVSADAFDVIAKREAGRVRIAYKRLG